MSPSRESEERAELNDPPDHGRILGISCTTLRDSFYQYLKLLHFLFSEPQGEPPNLLRLFSHRVLTNRRKANIMGTDNADPASPPQGFASGYDRPLGPRGRGHLVIVHDVVQSNLLVIDRL